MKRDAKIALLGNTVSPAFAAAMKDTGHVWVRHDGRALCSKCGCAGKSEEARKPCAA